MTPESEEFLDYCIAGARRQIIGSPDTPTEVDLQDLESFPPHSSLGSEPCSNPPDYEYHYGLPTNPVSIYYTGDPWPKPTGREAYLVPKEAIPIFTHPIAAVWRELGRQVYEYFDSVDLKWTTIDPIRFAEVGRNLVDFSPG